MEYPRKIAPAFLWRPERFDSELLHCFSRNWIFAYDRFHYDVRAIQLFPFLALYKGSVFSVHASFIMQEMSYQIFTRIDGEIQPNFTI